MGIENENGTNADTPGFLTLPAEIRLEIYLHLLVSPSPVLLLSDLDYYQHQLNFPLLDSEPTVGRSFARFCQLHWCLFCHTPRELLGIGLLRSCRTVWAEATPILYGKNTLTFYADETPNNNYLGSQAREHCASLMSYNVEDWAQSPIRSSTLAAFLRKIGPCNGRLIREIELRSLSAEGGRANLVFAAELCAKYTPGWPSLRLRLCFRHDTGKKLPWVVEAPVEPLCDAIQWFQTRVHWVKVIKLDDVFGRWVFKDEFAVSKLYGSVGKSGEEGR
ncbi:MAG: hypothetical protein Q9208_007346 [Pyrenodesmia sp. 3 TL-2023]